MNDKVRSLLDLHIAEYNALTARNTQWSAIQSNVWMLLIIALTFMVTFWTGHPDWVNSSIATTGVVIQGVLIGLCFATAEIYRNVYYIEHDLRRAVESLLGEKEFWQYEPFLYRRSGRKSWWSDAAGAGLGLLVLAIVTTALICYGRGSLRISTGIVLNFLCFAFLLFQTIGLIKQRQKFERATE